MNDNGEENHLVAERWVRVFGTCSSEGIWDKDGCEVGVEDLPVTKELQQQILDWQLEYERLWDLYQEVEIKDWPATNWHAFSFQGLELAKAVKAQLPDWTVMYFDEEKYAESEVDYRRKTMPRSYYDFEIKL